MTLILGSQSPRRKEILQFFSVPFIQVHSNFDEDLVVFQGDPSAFACEVARQKALCLTSRFPQDVILTADTVVYCKGKLFMKPNNLQEAHTMLLELAGKEHQVYTGVCVISQGRSFFEAEMTRIFFNELTEKQVHTYHDHIFPMDKAGGYAIQKGGTIIVKRIEGCYYNVMGLPIQLVLRLLSKVGIHLWDYLKPV